MRAIATLFLCCLMAANAARMANAKVYTEFATVDANDIKLTYNSSPDLADGFLQFSVPVVHLKLGDEYLLVLKFLPGQSITVTNCSPGPHCSGLLTFGDEVSLPSHANTPTAVTLIGAHGDGTKSEIGSCGDCFYGGINPLLDPSEVSSLTFRGAKYLGEATSAFSTSGIESLGISIGGITAGAITVNEVRVPSPESSTWTMLLIGFAAIGFAGYRRSRRKRIIYGAQAAKAPTGSLLPPVVVTVYDVDPECAVS